MESCRLWRSEIWIMRKPLVLTSIIIAISNRGSSLCMVLKEMHCLFALWKFDFPWAC